MTSIMWFRRDLRLRDNPALRAAAEHGDLLGLFVLDPALWASAGPARRAWLAASLRSLDDSMGGRLCVRLGPASSVVPLMAERGRGRPGARDQRLHALRPGSRQGRRRGAARATSRGSRPGTPYAVAPGTIVNGSGSPYKVFTPFSKAWRSHGWDDPQPAPRDVEWVEADDDERVAAMLDKALREAPDGMPTAGEDAAWRRFRSFLDRDVDDYDDLRDDPGADRTSRLSPYLKYGVVHPRQLLAETASPAQHRGATFETELAWREFYADVLFHNPASAWSDLNRVAGLTYDEPADAIEAWKTGTTGFPIVDAGMRQLLAEGWMHNRVRMITASFLTKDLHVWWPVGARHFLDHLVDGDLASNNHGWQWVAGTGHRRGAVLPRVQPGHPGAEVRPGGDYVRRWMPELAHLVGQGGARAVGRRGRLRPRLPAADHRPRGGASAGAGPLPARPRLKVSTTSWRARLRGPSPR